MRYCTLQEDRQGFETVLLQDHTTDSEVSIVPALGCNAVRVRLQGQEVVAQPPDLPTLQQNSSSYGIPVLSPPNRVRDGGFVFDGRTYSLPLTMPSHHIHGELKDLAWNVVRHVADDRGASLVCELRLIEHSAVYAYYPHELVYRCTYTLYDGALRLEAQVSNEGEQDSPFALGFHPYFALPEAAGGQAVVKAAVAEEWPIGPDRFLAGLPADGPRCAALREGMPLTELPDAGYLLFSLAAAPVSVCEIDYGPHSTRKLVYELQQGFPFVVLFRPSAGAVLSIEPYSCVTDAFNMPEQEERYGLIRLRAKEFRNYSWQLRLEEKERHE